jgi:hypothetical protein
MLVAERVKLILANEAKIKKLKAEIEELKANPPALTGEEILARLREVGCDPRMK